MPNVTTTYSQKELEELLRRHLGLSDAAKVIFSYDGGDGPRGGGAGVSASVVTTAPVARPTGGGYWDEKR